MIASSTETELQKQHRLHVERMRRIEARANSVKSGDVVQKTIRSSIEIVDRNEGPTKIVVYELPICRPVVIGVAGCVDDNLRQPTEIRKVSIRVIQLAVCRRHPGVTLNDLVASWRTKDVVRPRQIAMYLAKKITGRSLVEISRAFGGRDHTTVIHAIRKIERLLADDHSLKATIEEISGELIPSGGVV